MASSPVKQALEANWSCWPRLLLCLLYSQLDYHPATLLSIGNFQTLLAITKRIQSFSLVYLSKIPMFSLYISHFYIYLYFLALLFCIKSLRDMFLM
jgi:hypothetical protein